MPATCASLGQPHWPIAPPGTITCRRVAAEVAPGVEAIIGALFGGKRGELDFYGINDIGADRRPLNTYLSPDAW